MAGQPHDRFFRRVFGQRAHAVALFERVFPPDLASGLDFARARRWPEALVDRALGAQQGDVLWLVPWADAPSLLLVSNEHRSTEDTRMLLRLLAGTARIWDVWRLEHPREPLPPVLPVVVYHGRRPWRGPRRLAGLLAIPPDRARAVLRHQPDFEMVLVDLPRRPADEPWGTALCDLAVRLLVHGRRPDFLRRLADLAGLLRRVRWESGAPALEPVLHYIHEVRDEKDVPRETLDALLGADADPEVQEVLMTVAERLREEGRREGEALGRREGEVLGRREILARLLRRRFGRLPADVERRLEAADGETLGLWAERVLTATSLDEVVG
jgi:predicted transposase YdaD